MYQVDCIGYDIECESKDCGECFFHDQLEEERMMNQREFEKIFELSETGYQMVERLMDTLPLADKDQEYLRHMLHHIIHNERCDAAVLSREFMIK